MKWTDISPPLLRFMHQQQKYIALAVGIFATFWAIRPESANPIATLIYTLCLCNLVTLMQDQMLSFYDDRKPHFWLAYLALLVGLTPLMVALATTVVFWVFATPQASFWEYQRTSWRFPCVATISFGIVSQAYRVTRCRLEQRNRELQHAVESEIAERELQDQELERAREIQQALLPREIPQVGGFEIAGAWEPARIVGGDYFDVIRLTKTKLAICIADVVGKSVSAALLMANVQATIRAFASESASPSWLCSRVNSVLCNNIASGKFITLFYGVLDAERQTLQYTNAGHLRPVLISAAGTASQLENGGALLGVFPAWKYDDTVVQLRPGDRLLLFTDGITEAANLEDEEFGDERLIRTAAGLADRSTADLKDCLLKEVKAFCDSRLQDDVTLIVITALDGHHSAQGNVQADVLTTV